MGCSRFRGHLRRRPVQRWLSSVCAPEREAPSVPSSADVHVSGRPPLAGTLQLLEAPLIEARAVAASAAGADEQRHQDLGCEWSTVRLAVPGRGHCSVARTGSSVHAGSAGNRESRNWRKAGPPSATARDPQRARCRPPPRPLSVTSGCESRCVMNVDGAGQEVVRAGTAVVSTVGWAADRCNACRRRFSANRASALNERVECDCRVPVAMRQSHWRPARGAGLVPMGKSRGPVHARRESAASS